MEAEISKTDSGYYYTRKSFRAAGVDGFTKPPGQNPDLFEKLENVMPPSAGNIQRRWGYTLFASPAAATYRQMQMYENDTTNARRIVVSTSSRVDALNEDGTNYALALFTPSTQPRLVNSRDYAYFASGTSGDLKKWNGAAASGVSKWGIAKPVTAINVGASVAGSITLQRGRNYYLVFKNSTTGQISNLNPISASTGPITSRNIPLSSLEVSADSQVDQKLILATADGGDATTLYFLGQVTNGTITFTDTIPEATLLLNPIYLETNQAGLEIGVSDNDPPPNGIYPTKHRGRIFLASGQLVYFSKNANEVVTSTATTAGRYEECWPADYFFDCSVGAEAIRGMMSDGLSLYIGTERHIRRIDGDGPDTFSRPEVIFNEAGVLNQDVWKAGFVEGAPVGCLWLTPDFRVMASNFQAYADVGWQVQHILSTINSTVAQSKAHAVTVSNAQYDIYALAIPTGSNTECDTLLIYDLRRKTWVVWFLTDSSASMLFNINASGLPQFLFSSASVAGKIYNINASATQDRVGNTPADFTSTVQTSWLDLGQSTTRKVLNSLEVMTADSNLAVSVDGATNVGDFSSPTSVVSGTTLTGSYIGESFVPLAGKTTKFRFYRFKFVSTANASSVVDYYRTNVVPVHQLV